MNNLTLSKYLEKRVAYGKHYFLVSDLENELELNKSSISTSLSRMHKKKRLKIIKRGFGIILDGNGNEPHPSYYIDALMKHLGALYYVGILTAAAHWGASHQASMSYQVVVNKPINPIEFKRGRIEFVVKRNTFPEDGIIKVSGLGGYFNISSPERTAIDIVRFAKRAGHLNNVATVLDELIEKWDGRVVSSLFSDPDIPNITLQRLGYILEEILHKEKESKYVERALRKRRYSPSLLMNEEQVKMSSFLFVEKWKLYINTELEPD